MDIDEVRAFVAVAEAGSFKAAASRSGLPRGTLRGRVAALEDRVGATLLDRSRDGVAPTGPGRRLLEHGREMIREADRLFGLLRRLPSLGVRLRLALPLGTPPQGILKLFDFVSRVFPDLEIDMLYCERITPELLTSVDLALSFEAPALPGVRVRPIVEMHMGLRASASYLARHGTPRSPAELAEHRLLTWLGPLARDAWPLLDGDWLAIAPSFASPDFQLIRHLAANGTGIALLPDVNLPDLDPEDRKLVRVLPEQIGARHHLFAVKSESSSSSAAFDELLDGLRRFMAMMVPRAALPEWVRID